MASIQRRGGVFRVRVTRKGYPTLSKTFTSRLEALKWARNTETQIDTGQIRPNRTHSGRSVEGTTFAEACEHYEDTHTSLKRNHRSEALILKALRGWLGTQAVCAIDQPKIANLRDDLLRRGRSGTTVGHYLNAVSKVYQMLKDEWGMNVTNPVTGVKRPRPNPPRVVRLPPKAIETLLQACDESSETFLGPIVRVALETGMRRGEILGLQWKDIEWEQRRICINRSKNGFSRCIPASRPVLEVLTKISVCDSPSIFPIAPESMRKHYERAVRRAKSRWSDKNSNPFDNLTFHDLRHQALSQLSDRGLNVIELAEMSGHKTIAMLRRYTHPSHEAILAKINNIR